MCRAKTCVFPSLGRWLSPTLLPFAVLAGLLGCWPATAAAQSTPSPDIFAVGVSRGFAVEVNGSAAVDSDTLWFRWTRRPGGRVLGGEPAVGVEVIPLIRFHQDPRAYGGGLRLMLENRFRPHAPVRPVFRIAAGMIFTNRRVPAGETHHNFTALAGVGLEIDISRSNALSVEYRFQHLSNADTGGFRNPGINDHSVLLGLTW